MSLIRFLLTDEHLLQIGRVVMHATAMENLVKEGVWSLSDMDIERGRAVTGAMMYSEALEALTALIRSCRPELLENDQFKRLFIGGKGEKDGLGRLKAAAKLRNEYVHADWLSPSEEPGMAAKAFYTTRHGRLQLSFEWKKPEDIAQDADWISEIAGDLINFYVDNSIEYAPSKQP